MSTVLNVQVLNVQMLNVPVLIVSESDEDSMQIVWEPKEPLDRCLNRAELLQNHHRPPLARAGFSATAWLLTVLPVSTFFEATIQDTLLAKMGCL